MSSAKTYTDEERIKLQRECVAEHIALENAATKDIHTVLEKTFAKDGVFYDVVPGNAGRLEGLDGVVGFYEMLFATLPDMQITVTHQYDVPGCCILEGIVTGTHSAEFSGVPASGRFISFPFAAIYIFGEDPTKLVAERAYWDNEMLVAQMKGEAEPVTSYVWDGPNPYGSN
jgi:steroid delta-isomerase-like uncharacterized protein